MMKFNRKIYLIPAGKYENLLKELTQLKSSKKSNNHVGVRENVHSDVSTSKDSGSDDQDYPPEGAGDQEITERAGRAVSEKPHSSHQTKNATSEDPLNIEDDSADDNFDNIYSQKIGLSSALSESIKKSKNADKALPPPGVPYVNSGVGNSSLSSGKNIRKKKSLKNARKILKKEIKEKLPSKGVSKWIVLK